MENAIKEIARFIFWKNVLVMMRSLLFFPRDSKAEASAEVCEFRACGRRGLLVESIVTYQSSSGQGTLARSTAVAFSGVGYDPVACLSVLISFSLHCPASLCQKGVSP